jgi:cytochrome c peroxidase
MKNQLIFFFIISMMISCTDGSRQQEQKDNPALLSTSEEIEKKGFVIELSSHCPPGFELDKNNNCINRNLYQQYESLQNAGVGGLKTALPEVRDGFSPQQIDLGRYLFFDPILSLDSSVSCATCHHPDKGFSDGLAQSTGIKGRKVNRSAPGLWNVAFMHKFFWDGRSKSLEEQATGPLYNENEMGMNPELLFKTMNSIPEYKRLFSQAFPNGNEEIELVEIYTAITAFESSLISLNSRYDQYAHGYHEALSENEIAGMNVFRSFVARCAECHTPPLFTNQQIAVIGTPEPKGMPFDKGAEIPNMDSTLRGGFKVPSLRNIELTAPYNHSGVFKTLEETTAFYTKGRGHAVSKEQKLILHWHIWEPQLKEEEIDRIVDFLKTLTDESLKPQVPKALPSGLSI